MAIAELLSCGFEIIDYMLSLIGEESILLASVFFNGVLIFRGGAQWSGCALPYHSIWMDKSYAWECNASGECVRNLILKNTSKYHGYNTLESRSSSFCRTGTCYFSSLCRDEPGRSRDTWSDQRLRAEHGIVYWLVCEVNDEWSTRVITSGD